MCSLEVNDLINVNRSISDDEDNQPKLASGRIVEARSSSDSILPFLSSPVGLKQKVESDYQNKITHTGPRTRRAIIDDSPGPEERSIAGKASSPVRGAQRTLSQNNELTRKLSPAQGRVKDSITRHNLHLSNFLAANPGNDLSASSSLPLDDQSLDLTDLFHSDDHQTPLKSPSSAAPLEENKPVSVEPTNPERNRTRANNISPEVPNEKNLTFGKIRVRTHDITESGENLDWGPNNSESFVVDDYERRRFEKRKAQRKAVKQKRTLTRDAVGEDLQNNDRTTKSSEETLRDCRVGSLAALQPSNEESLDEDFCSLRSGRSDKSSSSRVSFGDVRVRRHKQTLGDHPCVSQGPPVALDWSYMSSQHFDLEDYETISGDRQKAQKISREEREELLRTKGVSDDSLSRIECEVQEIKASRRAVKDDKKKEDDMMIYKLLSSTSLREARLTSRRNVAETEMLNSRQKQRRNPTHLSDNQPTVVENGFKKPAAMQQADATSSETKAPSRFPRSWRTSLRNLFGRKTPQCRAATNILSDES